MSRSRMATDKPPSDGLAANFSSHVTFRQQSHGHVPHEAPAKLILVNCTESVIGVVSNREQKTAVA